MVAPPHEGFRAGAVGELVSELLRLVMREFWRGYVACCAESFVLVQDAQDVQDAFTVGRVARVARVAQDKPVHFTSALW